MTSIRYELESIKSVAEKIISELPLGVFCLHGDMGIGKTTLIKAMLRHLGAVDIGHSPTFGLVNEYHNVDGEVVAYHFDFYRIQSLEEALDIGLEDYFANDVPIFIEWPEKIEPLLPEDYRNISLYFIDKNTRRIEF